MMPPRCYIASPLGFTDAGRRYYRETYVPTLAAVVDVVDPWALTTQAELAEAQDTGTLDRLAATIGRRNLEAIRSAELLAAYLDGTELDSGTVVEMGYAAALGLTCFGLRTDLRDSGDLGRPINLQVEAVINESGGHLARSLAELVELLRGARPRRVPTLGG